MEVRLSPGIARERRSDDVPRLGLDGVHDAMLVGERPAQDDEAVLDEPVHEGRVRRPARSSSGRDAHFGPERWTVTRKAGMASQVLIAAMAALARSAISSGGTSSTCVAIDQTWPNGSVIVPKRSPQN